MITQLRKLALFKQGLTSQAKFGDAIAGTLAAIKHLGYVQIDTLCVIERAHHHVLYSRIPSYQPEYLNQLVNQRLIFEYWYHAAAYLPMSDYRFALRQMTSVRKGESRYFSFDDKTLLDEIVARIRAEGPSRLRDLNMDNKSNGKWWHTGPVKRAFERLFMQGDLMVCQRNGMEKVYDLTERCLPQGIDLTMPDDHQYATYLFDTTLRAHGVFTKQQLLHLKTGKSLRDAMIDVINQRLNDGEIVTVKDANNICYYLDSQLADQKVELEPSVKILSPFDNAVIHRERLLSLFDFDFKIECYVAAAKRVYGYFCLPILFNHEFVGRIDCKAHRQAQRFEVLSLHLEQKLQDKTLFFNQLNVELQRLADFNQCPKLDMDVVKG